MDFSADLEIFLAIVFVALVWVKFFSIRRYYLALKKNGAYDSSEPGLLRLVMSAKRQYRLDKEKWIREQEKH